MAGKNPLSGIKLNTVDDLFTTESERQGKTQESVLQIPLSEIHYFENHPFKIIDNNADMIELVNSISENGVKTPIIVRCKDDGEYEIISGHRRHRACELLGITEIPVIVRDISDDDAIIDMVDCNISREKILPSEKAFAFKMKLDAIKRQGARSDITSAQIVPKLQAREIVAKDAGTNRMDVTRYIRLTELIPPLLDMVDNNTLNFTSAVDISYLTREEQEQLYKIIDRDECFPSIAQAKKLKEQSQAGKLSEDVMEVIMSYEKPFDTKVVFQESRIKKYFPPSYTAQQMEDTIIKLLENWLKKRNQEHSR